jgi:hypothetical protein
MIVWHGISIILDIATEAQGHGKERKYNRKGVDLLQGRF